MDNAITLDAHDTDSSTPRYIRLLLVCVSRNDGVMNHFLFHSFVAFLSQFRWKGCCITCEGWRTFT
jgi:hypothetical protein